MMILYRILGIILSVFALIIAVALLFIIPISLTVPPLWLPTFLFVSIILYTWFSNKFQRLVITRQEAVKASLRDWVRVNGFVAIVFCFLNIPPLMALLRDPDAYIQLMKENLKQLGPQYEQSLQSSTTTVLAGFMLFYLVILFIHVLWTFSLMKKYQEHFSKEN